MTTVKQINWAVSKQEAIQISQIARRASLLAKECGFEYPAMTAEMDLTACHANGNPLNLERLIYADKFTFAHDVFGIRAHINREIGELEDCFVPRLSA